MAASKSNVGYRDGDTARQIAKGRAASFKILSAAEIAAPVPPMEFMIRGLWPLGSHGPLSGHKKTIKSYTALAMAIAVASQENAFGNSDWFVPNPYPVAVFAGEGGDRLARSRIQRIANDVYGIGRDDLTDLPIAVLPAHAQFDSTDFAGYLYRAIDEVLGEPPGLIIVDSVYNYHPSGQDVQVANVYDRGPMFARQSDLFYRECGQRSVAILVDHFKKSASNSTGSLDLDLISQSGMAEFADTWWLQGHRQKPDPDNGQFYLQVEVGSRQDWPGTAFELDWDIGRYDIYERKWEGKIEVDWRTTARAAGAFEGKTHVSDDDIRAGILDLVANNAWLLTKNQICGEVAKSRSAGTERVRSLFMELATAPDHPLVRDKRKRDEGGVPRERELWALGNGKIRA